MNTTFQNILNNLDTALVSFDKNGILQYYNNNVIFMWKIDKNFLDEKPYIVEFFEVLREKSIYPEKDDFRGFCKSLIDILNSNNGYNNSENIILPNSQNIVEKIINSNENLLILWEDTSDIWNITYNLNNHKNIYNRLIERNPYPITVITSNGLVENYNAKFLETMNLSSDFLNEKPHIRNLIPEVFKSYPEVDNNQKAILLGNILSNRNFNYKIKLTTIDETLVIYGIVLPNTTMFLLWQKATPTQIKIDQTKVNENLEKLHNNFILDLNSLVGSPLTTIMGFAELLHNEYVGSLNLRQKEYLNKIIEKTEFINQELNHKIQLSNLDEQEDITEESVDLNIILATILHQVKARIKIKNINIKLNLKNTLNNIISNEDLLNKALSLLLLYIIENNLNNASVEISIQQSSQNTIFMFKDYSKLPLLSDFDKNHRYDIKLALNILNKLNAEVECSYKNRSQRVLQITLNHS